MPISRSPLPPPRNVSWKVRGRAQKSSILISIHPVGEAETQTRRVIVEQRAESDGGGVQGQPPEGLGVQSARGERRSNIALTGVQHRLPTGEWREWPLGLGKAPFWGAGWAAVRPARGLVEYSRRELEKGWAGSEVAGGNPIPATGTADTCYRPAVTVLKDLPYSFI